MRDYEALIAYLDARVRTPFAWGSAAHDCVSFAAGAVEALTGNNPLAKAGRTWSGERGAVRVLRHLGGLEAAADSVLERLAAPSLAHRGDVGLAKIGDRSSLVIFEGVTVVGPGLNGLVRLPRSLASSAWSAGQ